MAGKLSPGAAVKVAQLEGFVPKVARLHALVETYATARTNPDTYQSNLKRAAEQLKLSLMGVGLDQLSQLCGSIALAAHRAGSLNTKTRILRELMGSLRFQLDFAIRNVIREDELQRSKDATSETSEA
jgi:hypothetical protein